MNQDPNLFLWLFWTRAGRGLVGSTHNWAVMANHRFYRKTATNTEKSSPKKYDRSFGPKVGPQNAETGNAEYEQQSKRSRNPEAQKATSRKFQKSRNPKTSHVQLEKGHWASKPMSQSQWSTEQLNQQAKRSMVQGRVWQKMRRNLHSLEVRF